VNRRGALSLFAGLFGARFLPCGAAASDFKFVGNLAEMHRDILKYSMFSAPLAAPQVLASDRWYALLREWAYPSGDFGEWFDENEDDGEDW